MRLNHIGNSGAKDLGHALAVNTSLQLLNIAANEFSDPACYVLGKMLYHNSTLKELDLSSNNLGIKGKQINCHILSKGASKYLIIILSKVAKLLHLHYV